MWLEHPFPVKRFNGKILGLSWLTKIVVAFFFYLLNSSCHFFGIVLSSNKQALWPSEKECPCREVLQWLQRESKTYEIRRVVVQALGFTIRSFIVGLC